MPKPTPQQYVVSVNYTGRGYAYVEATSPEDAIRKVEAGDSDSDECVEVEIADVGRAELNV